jgi:3'(2'), 5'-bisphosphate nucleotidase
VYNRCDPYMPDLLICRSEWAAPVLNAIKAMVPAG